MIYILQIAAVATGLALVALFNINSQRNTKLLLAFSGAYLFAIVILHLLPEMIAHTGTDVGLFVLAGFLLQILLDFYSTGLEHGHFHKDHFADRVLPVSAIAGLFVHAFFEGLPISIQPSEESTQMLLMAIVLHKIPIAVVLYTLLASLHIPPRTIWLALGAFALISPLGTVIGALIPGLTGVADYITAFAAGIFLHVSTTILFESSHNHRYNLAKLVVVVIGMALAYFSLVAIAH